MNNSLAALEVYFGGRASHRLNEIIRDSAYSKIAVLCDSNTQEKCLPHFLAELPNLAIENLEIIELEPGEGNKSLEVLAQLWDAFGALGLDKQSLLINLGGGVITDLGGFAAATYMRGMDFINFPTSLLAMADASVGSKTGINFSGFKNRIGLFADPIMVGILPDFLATLEQSEFQSGWAEMLKHGLIADGSHFEELIHLKPDFESITESLIKHTIEIKAAVVLSDKGEQGQRKILNFGHTLGHALESFYQSEGNGITHGHAVALGMQIELLLSSQYSGLDEHQAKAAKEALARQYPFPNQSIDKEELLNLVLGDKKNQAGEIRFALLSSIGKAEFDVSVTQEAILNVLEEFFNA